MAFGEISAPSSRSALAFADDEFVGPQMQPLLISISRAFLAASVRWALLRLPSGSAPNGGDIDLLVALDDVPCVRQILESFGFVNLTPYSRSVHMHFVTYYRPTDSWLWLDIVTELSFGRHNSLKTRAEEGCLARCRYHASIPRLAPDDDFWTLLAHCLLDKEFVAERHRITLQKLFSHARTDGPIAAALGKLFISGWSLSRMLSCVAGGDWSSLEKVAPELAAAAFRRHRFAPGQMINLRLSRAIDRVRNLRRNRGLSVALLGPDGAGKTTLMLAIQRSFILPVRPIYMGLTGGLLRYIGMLHVPGIVFLGRLLVFWSRYLLAQYHQVRGRLVIFDRYIYDAMVPHPERLNLIRRSSRWADGHACPGPDLLLVLDAPGTMMYARKGEYSAATLEEWRHYFLALQRRFPQVEIVDATQDRDTVRVDVIDRIWQRYISRSREHLATTNQQTPSTGAASIVA